MLHYKIFHVTSVHLQWNNRHNEKKIDTSTWKQEAVSIPFGIT